MININSGLNFDFGCICIGSVGGSEFGSKFNLTKIESDTAPIPKVSGTYTSKITRDTQRWPFQFLKNINPEVKLVQNGNEVTGSFGGSLGQIWGRIEGDTIFYNWQEGGSTSGKGKWIVKPGGNEIAGVWSHTWRGSGEWYLTKIEAAPIIDVSGTYIVDISGSKSLMRRLVRRPVTEIKLEVELVQNGNQITITYDGERGKIYGDIDGDTILIEWSNEGFGKGKLTIKPGSNELVGIFYSTGSGGYKAQGNGELNLTKIE